MELHQLTKPQKAIWSMEQYFGESIANITGSVILQKTVDIQRLRDSLNKMLKQCDSMRIHIKNQDGIPMQYISKFEFSEFDIIRFDIKEEFEGWIEILAGTPFELSGDLYEVFIIMVDNQIGFVLHLHHLIADAWTLNLLADIVMKNLEGEFVNINSYLDYITSEQEYELSARKQKDKDYFLVSFERCSEPVYLSDKQTKSITAKRLSCVIDKEDTTKIQVFCNDNNISPYSLFMNVLAIYLYRIKGAESMYIGTTILNRFGKKEKETAGIFVNTVPVLFHIDETKDVLDNIQENTQGIMSVFRHQKYQYSDLLKDIREKYNFTDRLYDIMLNYQNAGVSEKDIETAWHFCGCQGESLNIHINDRQHEGVFHLDYDYQSELFSGQDIERLHGHLMNLIFDIMENSYKKPYELKLLSKSEYQMIVNDFNDTTVEYSFDKCIHQLFEEQVKSTPLQNAVIACDTTLTYSELNIQANKVANAFIKRDIMANDIVAILLPRKSYLISAMIGILKSGGAYLPIDIDYPQERINYILKDNNAKFLLTTKDFVKNLIFCDNILLIEQLLSTINYSQPSVNVKLHNLCYCMYTSGSTGYPKGTLINHSCLINFVKNNDTNYLNILNESKISICANSIGFDFSVAEIFPILLSGKSFVLINDDEKTKPEIINNIIINNCVDLLQTTPTKLKTLLMQHNFYKAINTVEHIIFCGETFTEDLRQELMHLKPKLKISNYYGPTETTVWSSGGIVKGLDITIGKPIANTQIYILDKYLEPLPIGSVGELCIAGAGVGKGYLNRPKLTAEKFINNPFGNGKMYKTGDLAKWREDGNIEYIGRIDNQVKIRGLRIELGEIESAISQYEGIKQIAVVVKTDEGDRQFICSYYISDDDIDEKALRTELAKTLPRYMIPHFFTRLEAFPTTPSGKLDHKAFPAPDFKQSHSDVEYIAPVTEQEKVLVEILESVLGVSPIGMRDDFFDLGGDSLKAIEFVAKAHSIGIYFTLQNVFDCPTLAMLSEYIVKGDQPKVQYDIADFSDIHMLLRDNKMNNQITSIRKSPGNIFITGVTGWLGAHVLDAFLTQTEGKAYCLVRGSDLNNSCSRLKEILKQYFNEKYVKCDRIIPICGDITKKIWAEGQIDTIIHCAATVKHYGSYQYFHDINVNGTKNVIDFAKAKGVVLLHISTTGVSGYGLNHSMGGSNVIFDETKIFIGQFLDNVYVRSKFEAEAAVLRAKLEGLEAVVIRVGNLANRFSDLKFQKNYHENAILTRLKAFSNLKQYPESMKDFPLEFSPVDSTADAIISIAQHYNKEYSVFHAYNHKTVRFDDYIQALKELGGEIQPVTIEQFMEAVRASTKQPETAHIHEAFVNDINEKNELFFQDNIIQNSDFTVWYLNSIGFDWPEIGDEYLRQYIQYFRDIEYLEV